jgi:hypothetical protein
MLKLITEFKLELSEVAIEQLEVAIAHLAGVMVTEKLFTTTHVLRAFLACFVGVAHLRRPYGLVLKRESNLKTKTKHYTPRTQRGHFELQEKHCVDKVLI